MLASRNNAQRLPGRNDGPFHRRTVSLFAVLVLALLTVTVTGVGQTRLVGAPSYIEGKLVSVPEGCPILRVGAKDYVIVSPKTYLLHTLQDKRLVNREVRVEGTPKPDGTFEASKFFTVRDGKLYRVRYYCETCNIEALEPGNCVCCQRPTELQEIPVDESK